MHPLRESEKAMSSAIIVLKAISSNQIAVFHRSNDLCGRKALQAALIVTTSKHLATSVFLCLITGH